MPVNDVYSALSNAISQQQIDLVTAVATYPALADLATVLTDFQFGSHFVLSQVTLTGDNTTVTLTGSGSFGVAGAASYTVSGVLTYTDADGFTLTLRVAGRWSFAQFFPKLPDSLRGIPATDGQINGVAWTTSYLIGSQPSYAVVVTSPSFTGLSKPPTAQAAGKLQFVGLLPEFADPAISGRLGLLSPWPLRISGLIQMPTSADDYPSMELTAQGSGTNMLTSDQDSGAAGPGAFDLGSLQVVISCGPLPEEVLGQTAISQLTLKGAFNLSGGLKGVISTTILSGGRSWAFAMQFDPETASLTQGLAALTQLFGVPLPIPDDFPLLSAFHFAELDVDLLDTGDGKGLPKFSLRAFALTIVSNEPWVPPIPFISFENVGVRWVWGTSPVSDGKGGTINTYLMTGSIFGSVNLGDGGAGGALTGPQTPPQTPLPPSLARSFRPPSDGDPNGAITIDVSLQIPSFYIQAAMRDGDYISISDAFKRLFHTTSCPLVPDNMNVVGLSFDADPIGQTVNGQATILFGTPGNPSPEQAWKILTIGGFNISLQSLEMWIQAAGGYVGGGISGLFYLNGTAAPGADVPRMTVSAEYPPQGQGDGNGWLFGAHLYPGTSIDLTQMVASFINGTPNDPVPSYIPHLAVDALDATFATGKGAYTFAGTMSMRWQPTIFGTDLKINASASTAISRASSTDAVVGTLAGSFAVNKIAIMASMSIGAKEPTYLFKVLFGELWIQAVTSWRGDDAASRHQVVSVQLGGVTLGDILEYLVNLAAPTLGFQLDAPWNLLKKVDLSRFVLTIDPKDNVVEFVFNAAVDLGVMRVDTVGARYRRGTGQGKVELILTGNFFGQSYGTDNPLSWDVVNGNPPAVPGQGSSLVDLRFLGIGQRVTFDGPTPDSVAASVAALRQAMKPPERGQNPVGTGLRYDSGSQWLLGLDIGLMKTLDLGIIFNDPRLYGLSIALGGEKAGSLAGLRFEILYKKITNDIGMYRIELRVPDAFRTLQLGAVSLTLGIAVIEIYTNGNFKIDLGFPYNRDYSRSFSVQAGIFIGRGGFYFGVLNGDTSTSVPKITNGNFSPVIELGVGLAAGVGREISVGILSGGAYVEIEVLFQGVMAWFNPTASGAASAQYYRAQGVVAIHGKVYGKVDFVVISASVTLEAWAQAMVVFESYRPLLLDFQVGVRAEASVKILFIRISFHFSVTLDLSFTIGSASQTPWILANGAAGAVGSGSPSLRSALLHTASNPSLRRSAARNSYRAAMQAHLRRMAALRDPSANDLGSDPVLQWNPSQPVFDGVKIAHLTMLPYVTVADVPVDWAGVVPDNQTPTYRMAFLLYADTGMDVSAQTARQTALRSNANTTDMPIPADLLVSALLRYALYAIPGGPQSTSQPISLSQLLILGEELAKPDCVGSGFSLASLQTFFGTNLHFMIGGVPFGAQADYSDVAEKTAMLIPILPCLAWTSAQLASRDFSAFNPIGADYQSQVAAILGTYFPVGGDGGTAGQDDPAAYESFAAYVFRDFCQMVVKSAITEAQKQYVNVPIPAAALTASATLESLAQLFTPEMVGCVREVGDTVQSIAARLGATAAELLFLNDDLQATIDGTPIGQSMTVQVGVSPDQLAQDNAQTALTQKAWLLGDVPCPVGSPATTLQALASRFNIPQVASLFTYVPPVASGTYPLGRDPNLLRAGASFAIGAQRFVPPAWGKSSTAMAAAVVFVRYADPDLSQSTVAGHPDIPDWYAQTIPLLNANLGAGIANGSYTVEITPGTQLTVPSLYGQQDQCWTYVTVAGDTLYRIGCALTLVQDAASLAAQPDHWTDFLAAVSGSAAQGYTLPAWPLAGASGGVVVQPGDTVESLARRLIVNANCTGGVWTYDWTAISQWMGPAVILSSLAVVVLPGASISGGQSFTFQDLSDTYGLPIATLAQYLQKQPGLFPATATLTVRHIPVMTVAELEQGLLSGSSFAGVVNQSSRMLMSGLRLPDRKMVNGHVNADPTQPKPLYDLTGQQFSLTLPGANDRALQLSMVSNAHWATMAQTITVQAGQTVAALLALYPDLLAFNPGLTATSTLTAGSVLYTRLAQTITVQAGQTVSSLLAQYPDLLTYNPGLTTSTVLVAGDVLYTGLAQTIIVQAGQTVSSLLAQYPDLLTYNPGLTTSTVLVAGDVLFTGPGIAGGLAFNLTNAYVTGEAPAAGLALTTVPAAPPAPVALALRGTAPRTYGLEYPQVLQLAQPLPIPGNDGAVPLAGYATLWPFPQSLLDLAVGQSTIPFEIHAVSQAGPTVDTARPLTYSTYGCQISMRVQRASDGQGHYTLLGVDTQYRQLLLDLRAALLAEAASPAAQVRIALAPAPNAANAQGLAFLDTGVAVSLIKTNLSTDSQPQPQTVMLARLQDTGPLYYADLYGQLADFLLLLWEGSVVGGTGYYLGVAGELPASAFDDRGVATFTLVVLTGEQQAAANDGRMLKPYDNCLLVGPGLDASIHSLYAECADESDLAEVTLTPPGTSGFTLTLQRPPEDGSRQSALADRYNNLVYDCTGDATYSIPAAWTPALPTPDDGTDQAPWQRQRQTRRLGAAARSAAQDDASPYWRYEQVIPFYRFVSAPLPSSVAGQPDPANDPYRGFADHASYLSPDLTFCLSDLLGNHSQTADKPGQGTLSLPIGYTDALIGLSQWPELTAYYRVLSQSGNPVLTLSAALKSSAVLAAPSQRGDALLGVAAQMRDKYAQIYYQLSQPGLGASLTSSLCGNTAQSVTITPLLGFVSGAYAFTQTAARLAADLPVGQSLSQVIDGWHVRYAELAQANRDMLLSDLFPTGTTLSCPTFLPFIAQRSLNDLYAQRPTGWNDPASGAALFSVAGNGDLPMVAGTVMTLPNAVQISSGSGQTLSGLAADNHLTAALLAEQNLQTALFAAINTVDNATANVLVVHVPQPDGSVMTFSQAVSATCNSFATAQQHFAAQGVNVAVDQIAQDNGDQPGLLLSNVMLTNQVYVVQPGDTPSRNASGVTTAQLGAVNGGTAGIFDDGALVQFSSVAITVTADPTSADYTTLDLMAQRYACPIDLLLSQNPTALCGAHLAVPGCFAWPQAAADLADLYVPYSTRSTDKLTDVCTNFAAYGGGGGTASLYDCVAVNLTMPGTLAAGAVLTIASSAGTVTITLAAASSFAQALHQAQGVQPAVTQANLADAVGGATVLAQGALLLFPPALLPKTCQGADIVALYGVDPAAFALANTATPGLVAAGGDLSLPNSNKVMVHVQTQAGDTLNTLVVQFAVAGVSTDAGQIASQNPTTLTYQAVKALLPPQIAQSSIPLSASGPYPSTVFPLTAALTIKRPVDLIHPDFDRAGPVAVITTPLAAHADNGGAATDLTYTGFVADLTLALPGLRAGTAKVEGETSDLWCVDFTTSGIASVALKPGVTATGGMIPRFLALPPLYNHLVTRGQVGIAALLDDGTLSPTTVPTNFQAIDVEPWARRFLGDFDRFLSGSMASALYRTTSLQSVLTSAINSKAQLAPLVAADLTAVLNTGSGSDPNYSQGQTAAVAALRQQLGVSLLKAYDTSVLVQYDVQSTTPWGGQAANPPVSLYGQPSLTGTDTAVSFAAAKTNFTHDGQPAFVTMFATVADPQRHSYVQGTLAYDYAYTEFGITDQGVPAGYTASQWLSMMPLQTARTKPGALAGTNPGQVKAPVPLRTFPALPTINEQTARASNASPTSAAQLPLWTYGLSCTHEFAAQDSVQISVDFNLRKKPQMMLAVDPNDLFTTLAQYMAVADSLWAMLDPLSSAVSGNPSPAAQAAAQTFAALAAKVAQYWSIRLSDDSAGLSGDDPYVAGASYDFIASVKYDGQDLQSLTLTSLQTDPGPGAVWPDVSALLPDGIRIALTQQAGSGNSRTYLVPAQPPIAARNQQSFVIEWGGINVSAYQNARARMMVQRNADLMDDAALPTSQRFLLQTAQVTATNIVTPLLSNGGVQTISGTSLANALSTAIAAMFPPAQVVAGTTASWGLFYAYQLNRGATGQQLLSRTPVAFYPNQPLSTAAADLTAAVNAWTAQARPSSQGGGWLFNLVLYSGLESDARPLLSADLVYSLTAGEQAAAED